jgi:hypothetical protein
MVNPLLFLVSSWTLQSGLQLASCIQPLATRLQPQQKSSQYLAHLLQAQFVHIKRGAAASSLTVLYAGLYRVMERRGKYFYIEGGE